MDNRHLTAACAGVAALIATSLAAPPAQADGPVLDVTYLKVEDVVLSGSPSDNLDITVTTKGNSYIVKNDQRVSANVNLRRDGWPYLDAWSIGDLLPNTPSQSISTIHSYPSQSFDTAKYGGLGRYTLRIDELSYYDSSEWEYRTVSDANTASFYVRGLSKASVSRKSSGRTVSFGVSGEFYDPQNERMYSAFNSALNDVPVQIQYKSGSSWKVAKTATMYNGKVSINVTQTTRDRVYRVAIPRTSFSTAAYTSAQPLRVKDATKTTQSVSRKGSKVTVKVGATRQTLSDGKFRALSSGKAVVQYYSQGKWKNWKTVSLKSGKGTVSATLAGARTFRTVLSGTSDLASSASSSVRR